MRPVFYLLLVILAVAGAYFWTMGGEKSDNSNNGSSSQGSNIEPGPYEGWKTYSNEDYGIKVKYPPNYEIDGKEDSQSEQTGHLFSIQFLLKDSTNPANFVDSLHISIFSNQKDLDLIQWREEYGNNPNPYENIEINGNQAVKYSINEMGNEAENIYAQSIDKDYFYNFSGTDSETFKNFIHSIEFLR